MTKKFINSLKLELVHVALRWVVSQKPNLILFSSETTAE